MRLATLVLALAAIVRAAVPTPEQHLGYRAGSDYKLADYADISGYFRKLAAASDRIKLVEFGKSSEGRPMLVAFLSSAENLKQLDRYREISRRLALGRATAAEASKLASEGKAIVWIDSGLHASEVAPVQQSPELAYKMLTDESPEVERIRRNVILMQIPVINPDGLDLIAHWYRKNVGTPFETAPLPGLYQKYAGHDNNRDWFMLNLPETRAVTRLLFQEWFPQIVYNQHQEPAFPARIFVPPYAEPLNPNIPAPVMEGINKIGAAIKERFAIENKPGVLSYFGYDAWWNGGLRSVPAFHNMHGILTETAGYHSATPYTYDAKDFPSNFGNGMPTREPTVFYERPWMGGAWRLRDAVDYMLTADFAILNLAAQDPAAWLQKAWTLARANIEAGEKTAPYAWVVPADQSDRATAADMVERLAASGIEVKRARAAFSVGAKQYAAGSYVLLAGQPFRSYLTDVMEPQKYPEIRTGQTGPTKRPYDVAGWTLPLMMGVRAERAEDRFAAELEPVAEFKAEGVVRGKGAVFTLDPRENAVYSALPFFLGRGEKVRWAADGTVVIESAYVENESRAMNFARQYGLTVTLRDAAPAAPAYELRAPRVAIYEPWMPNMDAGWTQYVLDKFAVPHTLIHNADFAQSNLRDRFDTIILASQAPASILHGFRNGEARPSQRGDRAPFVQRPEYTGGIGATGVAMLEKFVQEGGTLIALDAATELPIEHFGLPVRNVVRGENGFYSPGSVLRMTANPSHPLAYGMAAEFTGFTSGGAAFEPSLAPGFDGGVTIAARYADKNLLASGWVSGERQAAGKAVAVECKLGKGRVVLFGFRPQFRGQPHGTFRLLLNAVYLGSAVKL